MSWRKNVKKLLRALFAKSAGGPDSQVDGRVEHVQPSDRLTGDVRRDVRRIQNMFAQTSELVVRWLEDPPPGGKPAAVLFIDGLVRSASIAEYVIAPLIRGDQESEGPTPADKQTVKTMGEAAHALTFGKCLLLRQGQETSAFDVHKWEKRAVPRAQIEPTEIGSQEGFTEDLFTNIVLVRRRLRTHRLQTERLEIGNVSPTDVRLLYIKDIARDALVQEVRGRLKEVDLDSVVGSNVLAEMTSDSPWSPFPNSIQTARPDRAVAMLLEGYVVVLVDGTPMAMVVPGIFTALFQSADDYYDNFYVASFTRAVRWLAALLGLLASSIYVAVISYHHELIPPRLLFTIAAGREGVPFPPVMEAFVMELAFELLREAGLRVPSQIGQAVSIVGVLVIGDAAVRAGLVSPLMIVVVGMTAISTFAVPANQLSNALRLLRFPLVALSGFLGLFGITFGLMLLAALLISSRSFGVPYTTPFVPLWPKGLVDSIVRGPMWRQQYRPWHLVDPDTIRQQPAGQRPRPESTGHDKPGQKSKPSDKEGRP